MRGRSSGSPTYGEAALATETGINILEVRCTVVRPMVKNRFVVEVGDTTALKNCISKLRNVESVFDAYRVTPSG